MGRKLSVCDGFATAKVSRCSRKQLPSLTIVGKHVTIESRQTGDIIDKMSPQKGGLLPKRGLHNSYFVQQRHAPEDPYVRFQA